MQQQQQEEGRGDGDVGFVVHHQQGEEKSATTRGTSQHHEQSMVPVDTTMTRFMHRKRERSCLQWLDYDADVIDNMSRTKRFVTESVSDDIVSKMSFSEERDTAMLSPSPLSMRRVTGQSIDETIDTSSRTHKDDDDDVDYVTPRKVKGTVRKAGQYHTRTRFMQSPSDMRMDEQDLRKTALVRLALRNVEERREGGDMTH